MRSTQTNWTFRLLSICFLLLISALIIPPSWARQEPSAKSATSGQGKTSRPRLRARPFARNAQISKLVSQIDARNIENTIRKLVSFGTRNTLSDQNDPRRGIGAARDWLYGRSEEHTSELQSRGH